MPFRICHLLASVHLIACMVAGQLVDMEEPGVPEEKASESLLSPTLKLNRMNFHGNVLQSKGSKDLIGQWFVSFCPSWWEPCQRLEAPFAEMTITWENQLNTALLTKDVRFAAVDCAIDKVLCNEQGVETYPTVHRYRDGKRIASWSGGRRDDPERLAKWLQRQLANAGHPAPPVDSSFHFKLSQLTPGGRTLDFILVFGVLALNFRAVCNNPGLSQKQPRAASTHQAARSEQPVQARIPGTARFLPDAWGIARPCFWL